MKGLVRNAVGIEQGQQPPRCNMLLHLIGRLQADAGPESAAVSKAGQWLM